MSVLRPEQNRCFDSTTLQTLHIQHSTESQQLLQPAVLTFARLSPFSRARIFSVAHSSFNHLELRVAQAGTGALVVFLFSGRPPMPFVNRRCSNTFSHSSNTAQA